MDIDIKNLSFAYQKKVKKEVRKTQVLNNLDLKIQSGIILSILGESGTGKTTLLRCIAGLEEKYEGQIFFDNKITTPLERRKSLIAYISQEFALYPHMTIYDNLAFPLKIEGASYDEIEERVLRMADILGMSELLSRKPKELSIGQQQKVAIGRAYIRMCEVYLLDEPFSNLDNKSSENIRAFLHEMHQTTNSTFIYSTHSVKDALSLSDYVAVLSKDGNIAQIDTPKKIFNHPQTEEVRKLMSASEKETREFKEAIKK